MDRAAVDRPGWEHSGGARHGEAAVFAPVVFDADDFGPDVLESDLVGSVPSDLEVEALFAEAAAEAATNDTVEEAVSRILALRTEMELLAALEQRELAALASRTRRAAGGSGAEQELAHRSLVAELAIACRVSERTMAGRIDQAEILVDRFPTTLRAIETGRIALAQARVIVEHGLPIEDALVRAAYENTVLERGAALTPGRLHRVAQRVAATVGELDFQQRHAQARASRAVWVRELSDGMSEIIHRLPTVLAEAIWDRLTAQAKAITEHARANTDGASHTGEPRSYDQLRSDLAAELLLTGEPSGCEDAPHAAATGIRAEIALTIPALTLLGAGAEPAAITGRGPIDLNTALALAADTPHWTRVITHPVTGMVLTVDSYRPTEQLRRYLRARDQRCRFPSCNRSPARCDIDHTVDAQYGGKTTLENLAHLCRRHHTLKHHTPWRVRQPAPGVLHWTSPLGQTITDQPEEPIPKPPPVRFR